MQNRFKKSLEQAENRAEDRTAASGGEVKPTAENKTITAPAYDIFTDTAQKKRGRDINIYLTREVWETVNALSKQLEISRSMVVDRALRHALKIR